MGASRDYPQTIEPGNPENCLKNRLWTIPRVKRSASPGSGEASNHAVDDTPIPRSDNKNVSTHHLRMFETQFLRQFKGYQVVLALFYAIKIVICTIIIFQNKHLLACGVGDTPIGDVAAWTIPESCMTIILCNYAH